MTDTADTNTTQTPGTGASRPATAPGGPTPATPTGHQSAGSGVHRSAQEARRAPGPEQPPGADADNDATTAAEAEPEPSPSNGVDDDAAAIEGELGELVETTRQRDEYLALAQRTQADFENYRKRVARDGALAQQRGVAKLAKELLPALDNLDRALEGADEQDPLLQGVRLVRADIAAALTRVGIEAFSPLGEPFDPNQQEAMVQQPVEGVDSGTVAEVYQDGYRMGETIIRPARVLVAA